MQWLSKVYQTPPESRDMRRMLWPTVFAGFALIIFLGVGYSLDADRSLSEREGVVSQSEAENDVIPSLPPN